MPGGGTPVGRRPTCDKAAYQDVKSNAFLCVTNGIACMKWSSGTEMHRMG